MGLLRTKIRKWLGGSEISIHKVADEAARLALDYDFARDKIIEQTDDSSQWVLDEDGDPSVAANWDNIEGPYMPLLGIRGKKDSAEGITDTHEIVEDDLGYAVILPGVSQGTVTFDNLGTTSGFVIIKASALNTVTLQETFITQDGLFVTNPVLAANQSAWILRFQSNWYWLNYVKHASQAQVDAAASASGDAVVRAQHLRIRFGTNSSVSAGNLAGDTRGDFSISIQSGRSASTNTSTGDYSMALGYDSSATQNQSQGVGIACQATGTNSSAYGGYVQCSAQEASGFGWDLNSSGSFSALLGYKLRNTVSGVAEVGSWVSTTSRGGSVRCHRNTGMVGITLQDRSTAYGDGGATAGSEADNTLMRGGYAIRRDGNDIYLDLNIGGTIRTLSLGTAT